MNQPILSICIPTYNREKYLKRLLDGLLPQVEDSKGLVNLFISDNASTDCTEDLCSKYIDAGFKIKYVRNKENKGADFNIAQAFSLGDTEYVWVLGDDEFIYDGALECLISMLQSHDISLLYLDSEAYIEPQSKAIRKNSIELEFFESAESFSKKIGVFFTFISGIIVNKKELLQKNKDFKTEAGLGTNLIQLSWVFTLLESGSRFVKTKNKVLAAEPDNTGGYRLFTVFGKNLAKMASLFLSRNTRAKQHILSSAMWFLSTWHYKEKDNFVNEDSLKSMDDAFISLPLYKFIMRPTLRYKFPGSLIAIRIAIKIRKKLRGQL